MKKPVKSACLSVSILSALMFAAGLARAAPPSAPPPPTESDWRSPDPENVLVIDTSKGRVIVEMTPWVAPLAVARVRQLTRMGVYNGRQFFRVIDEFMDQTGDPSDNGTGGSSLPNLAPEFTFRRGADTPLNVAMKADGLEGGFIGSLPVNSQPLDLAALTADQKVRAWGVFCPGVGGMARANEPDSANAQFFLMRSTNATLDQKYTPWGRTIVGIDTLRAIKTGEPPTPPADLMVKVRILSDIPAAERPRVQVINTAGSWFKMEVERVRVAKVVGFSICDIDLPSRVN